MGLTSWRNRVYWGLLGSICQEGEGHLTPWAWQAGEEGFKLKVLGEGNLSPSHFYQFDVSVKGNRRPDYPGHGEGQDTNFFTSVFTMKCFSQVCRSTGPALLNKFVGNRDSGIECTVIKFADDTRLCGAVNTLEGRDVTQKDLDKLEWASAKFMKFKKAKGKVPLLGWGNPKQKYKLGKERTENNPGEKHLGVSVEKKIDMTQ
ncbi:rna-directed dna polymerase from mobile element jockey-like [Willisornis vidua]|uniref:Rna-directed dna polymerase from mobile element jockey-like n=1 Tax=Willisornis vidua TaxID=1566151 RepID=A0ABQ9DR23_9PASS|nr:rna-directed dna polymerase from mobile element jockey-like [Willisornis vidua]